MPVPATISSHKLHCKRDYSAGFGEIGFWDTSGFRQEVKLPLVAAWVNPKNYKPIRIHWRLEMWRREHRDFYAGLDAFPDGLPDVNDLTNQLAYIAHKSGSKHLVRFGFKGRNYPFTDAESGQSLTYFACKQIMVKELLEYLQRWQPIAGLGAIDFSVVPPEWLEERGAIKLPDMLRKSTDMWAADFGWMLRESMKKVEQSGGASYDSYRLEPAAKSLISQIQNLIA